MAEETAVRDQLARDRTALANERTLLAYGRTALALVVLAAFIFKFSPTPMGYAFGASAIIGAAGIMFIGTRKYRAISSHLTAATSQDVD